MKGPGKPRQRNINIKPSTSVFLLTQIVGFRFHPPGESSRCWWPLGSPKLSDWFACRHSDGNLGTIAGVGLVGPGGGRGSGLMGGFRCELRFKGCFLSMFF